MFVLKRITCRGVGEAVYQDKFCVCVWCSLSSFVIEISYYYYCCC